jgi:adenylate cyclase
MHCGEIVMGHVGALDHYEYRAVGDIVNSASRLEGLNKQLGTRILVSEDVIQGLPGLHSRALGSFVLAGKHQAIAVHELLSASVDGQIVDDFAGFNRALLAFQEQDWHAAQKMFSTYLEQHPHDGPTRFYIEQCAQFLQQPPTDWQGAILLTQK